MLTAQNKIFQANFTLDLKWPSSIRTFLVRFEAFTAVTMNNVVFWEVALCRFCVDRRFGGTYRLHLQGSKIRERNTSVGRWVQSTSTYTDLHSATSQKTTLFRTFLDNVKLGHVVIPCILWEIIFVTVFTRARHKSVPWAGRTEFTPYSSTLCPI
jgi:hypothetical protein